MQVLIEVDLDGTEWSVRQDGDRFTRMSPDGVCDHSEIVVRVLGTAVGKMLAALISDSTTPSDLMAVFQAEITRFTGNVPSHVCDGVGCC